ncbi:hypothetical protein HBO07_25590 [Pseudomonas proteolytica]|uniref:hypothetical protein n=1 Tax=Pseudomonas proteolytica TaxID=219574 RepID=UPI001475B551|nr:hypothetical protein [Pseudomonas proteolytica]NMZ14649.1 hypothetical protein [Pseudomonas proteolytica]
MNPLAEILGVANQVCGRTSPLSLVDVVDRVAEWPQGVTAVTQEHDGELLYWDAPVDDVKQARARAGAGSMLRELGIKHQIHSAYLNPNNPVLAHDWQVRVVVPPIVAQ